MDIKDCDRKILELVVLRAGHMASHGVLPFYTYLKKDSFSMCHYPTRQYNPTI